MLRVLVLFCLTVVVAVSPSLAGEKTAASEVIGKLIDAHGGMDKWRATRTVSFEHKLVSPQEPDDPWVSREITDQRTRREYQEWPLDEAVICFDGENTWSMNWKRLNPPKFMVNLAYYFLNLPWITQDPGVILEGPGTGTLPADDTEYITIKMTFEAGTGESPDDYYVIYIDPETHLMKATEYIVTYGAMLDLFKVPAEVTFLGPLYHVYDDYTTVDGLVMPSKYRTYDPAGNVYGHHTVSNYAFDKPFDDSKMKMPEGAKIDTSSNKRKVQKEG
jgi:hypothetical protein